MITVLGSLNMDLVTNVQRTPRVGETVLGQDLNKIPGGKGANQAVAIGRLGGTVEMIGAIGEDAFGEILLESLRESSVDSTKIQKKKGPTGVAMIMVNASGDNSIVVIPGANYLLESHDVNAISGDILLAQLEVKMDVIKDAFKKAKDQGKYTILNPAPAKPLDDDLLQTIDLLIPNETELEAITGVKAIEEGCKILHQKGVKEMIVTLGEEGSLYYDGEGFVSFDAMPVEAVDTTAAGDSFAGALAYSLDRGKAIPEAIQYATKVASITVTKLGAQSSLPYKEMIE